MGVAAVKEVNNVFDWLQYWYHSQCNGVWEYSFGITIKTVDNPGWYLIINLAGTEIEKVPFETIEYETIEIDWYYCQLRDKNFDSSCGPLNLTLILNVFRKWIETVSAMSQKIGKIQISSNNVFEWLQKWYYSQCDGDWEHEFGVSIETIDNPGWHIIINLTGTECEEYYFDCVKEDINEDNWYFCTVKDNNFEASCSANNLTLVIQLFRDWIEQNKGIKIDK